MLKQIKKVCDVHGLVGNESLATQIVLDGQIKSAGKMITVPKRACWVISLERIDDVLFYKVHHMEKMIEGRLVIYLFHTNTHLFFLMGDKVCCVSAGKRNGWNSPENNA